LLMLPLTVLLRRSANRVLVYWARVGEGPANEGPANEGSGAIQSAETALLMLRSLRRQRKLGKPLKRRVNKHYHSDLFTRLFSGFPSFLCLLKLLSISKAVSADCIESR
jgi:hypothetical protein